MESKRESREVGEQFRDFYCSPGGDGVNENKEKVDLRYFGTRLDLVME